VKAIDAVSIRARQASYSAADSIPAIDMVRAAMLRDSRRDSATSRSPRLKPCPRNRMQDTWLHAHDDATSCAGAGSSRQRQGVKEPDGPA